MTQAFIFNKFKRFKRKAYPKTFFVTLTEYDKTFTCPYAFAEESVKNNLGSILSKHGLNQIRIAETEKYGHVTFFFNSQIEVPYKGEERVMIR